jgi:hypothetical protein
VAYVRLFSSQTTVSGLYVIIPVQARSQVLVTSLFREAMESAGVDWRSTHTPPAPEPLPTIPPIPFPVPSASIHFPHGDKASGVFAYDSSGTLQPSIPSAKGFVDVSSASRVTLELLSRLDDA